jgi:hypothetical protein
MTEIQMTKTKKLLGAYQQCLALFWVLKHSNFGFVSDFVPPWRDSDFEFIQ